MKRLLIVGAGNLGREVLAWALDIPATQRDWEVAGFLDSRTAILDGYHCGYCILGSPDTYEIVNNDCFICAVGDPKQRLAYSANIQVRGGKFINIIHPSAIVGSRSFLGVGCILCPQSIVTTDVRLGDFVLLDLHATVAHDSIVGDGCTLCSHAALTGWTRIADGVFLGSHAVVIPHVEIGAYATIGAGSVVLHNVPPEATMVGVPARHIAGKNM